jgi:two-component system, OmpR family, sensor kinase
VTLRLKLLVAVIVLVFAGLAVSAVVTYTSLHTFLIQRVDQQLVQAQNPMLGALNQAAEGHGGPLPGGSNALLPPGTYGEVRDAAGTVVAAKTITYGPDGTPAKPDLTSPLPAMGPDGLSEAFNVDAVGSSVRFRARTSSIIFQPSRTTGTLIVAIPLTEVTQTLHRLLGIEALVAGLVVIGLGFVSWWLVQRGLRPLEQIGVTAGAIAAGDLSQRVPQEDPRTEVGRLGVSLNAMLAQIEEAFAERKASEDRLRRFLADASHELRTPLTSIRGYAELFRRGASQRQQDLEKSMRRIEDESARMGMIVEDLLTLARLDQDRPLEYDQVDLAAIAADAAEDARTGDGEREIRVDAPGPVPVLGDEARLRQVAANLVGNAIVHTPAGTPITVRARANGENAVFEVADRGPGLSAETSDRAFEPFYRADPSRDRSTGGVGLGLAIVAAIAGAHGGRVEVAETPGGGATFRVFIPKGDPVPPDAADEPSPATEIEAPARPDPAP